MAVNIDGWEVCATNYPHPTITTGQHTNGPARVWVLVDGAWQDTGSACMHKVLCELRKNGATRIMNGTWAGGRGAGWIAEDNKE